MRKKSREQEYTDPPYITGIQSFLNDSNQDMRVLSGMEDITSRRHGILADFCTAINDFFGPES